MSTQPTLQEKFGKALSQVCDVVRAELGSKFCSEIAQQAITEAVAESVAEKDKKIHELHKYLEGELRVCEKSGRVIEAILFQSVLSMMRDELGLISK